MSCGRWKVPQNFLYIFFVEDFNVYRRSKTRKPVLDGILKDEGSDP